MNETVARILIVEDEHIIAADLEMKLVAMGYQVVGAAVTGEEAVDLAERHRPDAVLMDIQLEGRMNGREAAEIIRTEHCVPIIFITAFAGMLSREMQDGTPEVCLSKPFSTAELRESLQAVLNRKRSNV